MGEYIPKAEDFFTKRPSGIYHTRFQTDPRHRKKTEIHGRQGIQKAKDPEKLRMGDKGTIRCFAHDYVGVVI